MAFLLYVANRMEDLAAVFADRVYRVADPAGENMLAPHTVVVQTRGMAAFLEQYLAGCAPVAANLDLPFPNSFVNRILHDCYGQAFHEAQKAGAPENVRWRIMRLLCSAPERYPELAHYTRNPNAELKRWQLAGRIAALFDQYQLYRFDRMDRLWDSSGRDAGWQRRLYDELFVRTPGRDWFFRKFLAEETLPAARLPRAVSVFGVGALPPVYLEILLKLGAATTVHFFYLSPCREYWEHQYSRTEAARLLEPWEAPEPGNPLLQALGASGRGFFTALLQRGGDGVVEEEHYRDFAPATAPGPDGYAPDATMLQVLQQDILNLYDRRPEADPSVAEITGAPRPECAGDGTVAIHNCHGPRREIEILHDELLRIMHDPAIQPRDVIVMAPEIEPYVPLIEAVFDQGPLQDVYSIADRPPPDAALMLDAFHRLLDTAHGRFELSEILALLDVTPLAERLGIGENELELIGEWVARAGIRWGFDARQRERFCAVEFDEFSWRMGLDRLLMGFARATDADSALEPDRIIAVESAEGGQAELLGQFTEFVIRLARLAEELDRPRPAEAWCALFDRMLADFFPDGNTARTGLAALRGAIAILRRESRDGLSSTPLPLNAVTAMLDEVLPVEKESSGFLRGRITFCKMLPMRSIPVAVVAILGLNDKAFPRRDLRLGFNLAAERQLPGDRSQAAQDRYLLLEALLAARRAVWFFYCGQSMRDDKEFPPAAPLAEIMEYCRNAFGLTAVRHKLSGVDLDYFGLGDDPRRRSFDRESFEAALAGTRLLAADSAGPAYPELGAVPRGSALELAELVEFFRNPGKYLLETRLTMHWEAFEPEPPADSEPWALDGLDRYKLDGMLAHWMLDAVPPEAQYHLADRMNLLAPGAPGRRDFEQRFALMNRMPAVWRERLRRGERRLLDLALPEMALTLTGWSHGAPDGSAIYCWRFGRFDCRTALPAVLGQLAWTVRLGAPVHGFMLNLEKAAFVERRLPPLAPEAARERLLELLDLYYAEYRLRPPPIFPSASPAKAAGRSGVAEFVGYNGFGDGDQPGIREFFTSGDFDNPDFAAEFARLAELLYGRIETEPGRAES